MVCVDPWLMDHHCCPMCKLDILTAFGNQVKKAALLNLIYIQYSDNLIYIQYSDNLIYIQYSDNIVYMQYSDNLLYIQYSDNLSSCMLCYISLILCIDLPA